MRNMGRVFKIWLPFLLGLAVVLGVASCGSNRLPEVSALTTPRLPAWIEQISPTGQAGPLDQIRIRFADALIPVESIDSPDQQAKLKLFEIQPSLPGQFRFLTPRMVGFQADRALPKAARIKVTLKSGLSDLKNHRLDQDLAWTFNTEPIKLSNLPGASNSAEGISEADDQPVSLTPTLEVTANVELDLASVQDRVKLLPEGQKASVPVKIALKKSETASPSSDQPPEKFDPSARSWIYTVTPQQALAKATRYRLEFAPDLRSIDGNLPSDTAFAGQLTTYSQLAFKGLKYEGQPNSGGAYGRFVKGSAQLEFNNGLVAESAAANITVSPAPKKGLPLVRADDDNNLVSLNPWALEPATAYTVTLAANLKDQFGQTLGKPVTLQYETGDVAGEIWVPSGLHIFPAGNDLQLNIAAVNLPESTYKAAYRVIQPADLVYSDSAYPKGEGNDWLPAASAWQSFPIAGQKNQSAAVAVPLRERLGSATGLLAYGIQARAYRYAENGKDQWFEPVTYGLVQLTDLGVFAQWFPDAGLVRVHHLSDGSPVPNASVEIYESKLEAQARPQPSPCASGNTDPTGILRLSSQDLRQCVKGGGQSFSEAPQLLVIARQGQDWAFTRSLEYSGAYGYGIDAGWQSNQPESRGVIFSDRQLYQPGEKAWFTGVADYLQNGLLKQDKNIAYAVSLEGPNGQKRDLGSQTTNEFGTFSLAVPLDANQPLGYYSIRAKGESGAEIAGEFRVAEFKPPNFKVDLVLDKTIALANQKVEAKVQSNYLFGAPVEGGKIQYYVTRQQTTFIPKGWEAFSFGRQWFWPEESPSVASDVLQQSAVLSEAGQGAQTVSVAQDLPYPMAYRVDAQIADVSNLSVSDSKTFTALPSDTLIGLQSQFVAEAGKPLALQVIVTDPAGQAKAGQRLKLELQAMQYSSVTQVVEGSDTARNQVEYKTVGQVEVQSGSSPQTVSLTPPQSGSYRIRANLANAKEERSATDLQIWATGSNAVAWGQESDNRLQVRLDKETYRLGETATALIQSPYPEAELYFAVVRNRTIYRTTTKIKGGAPQIRFKVTPEMLPNAAVEAVLVRQGPPLAQVEPGSLDNLTRIGFAPFQVNLENQYLKLQLKPGQPQLEPGAEQTIQLELQDAQGRPARGQVTVMVVNEAVLQLSGYRPPNLVETVYAAQPISLRFSDNRPDVVLQPLSSPVDKGWGYGGGLSQGAAGTRIRTDFQALAYYNGSVRTDAQGKAQLSFRLPDDLTTWRVMAVATDGEQRFGNGEASFLTSRPLLSNPLLPQFARPGDRLEAGVAVTNNTRQSGSLTLDGQLSGGLQFVDNNQSSQTRRSQAQAEAGTQAYRFPIVAGSAGQAKLRFTSQLGAASDAFELPLEIKPLAITEQVVETGVTTNQVKIPLNVDAQVVPDAGGLELSLASSLIAEITAPARQVLEEDELPFLEPAASQLAIAANLQILAQRYGQPIGNFKPAQQATRALQRLQKLQRPDGGFATWPGQEASNPLVSPYAARAIARARQAFGQGVLPAASAPVRVNPALVSRLTAYLKKILADPGQSDYCQDARCKSQVRLEALSALAELGDRRNDFLSDLYAQREQFDLLTRIKLARYLSQFLTWRQEARTLLNQVQASLYQTGRTATVNLPQGLSWLASPTATQAQALRLFIAQKREPASLDRLLQSLLNLRREGVWPSTYDNAEALTALVAYSQLQPTPPSFAATAQLAGKTLGSARFEGYRTPSLDLQVPMAQLPRNRQELTLKKAGSGQLHYLVAYRYRLQGNQPGRLNGLRVLRSVRAANQAKALQQVGLQPPEQPLSVAAGQVFEIGLEIITDHPVDQVVISDPLPAGFEAVDASFQTATPALQAQSDSWQLAYQTIYRDRVVAYGDHLEAGVYSLHYLVRSVTPGTFLWPGAEAHLQYAPEEFGRTASSTLVVSSP